jgi:hypothetical protein
MALQRWLWTIFLLCAGCAAPGNRAPSNGLEDPPLHAALREILCRVERYCGLLELQVIDRRSEQAEMFPDGRLQIHLGLLLATHHEAEVAFILAHETAHRRLRHRHVTEPARRLRLELEADADASLALQAAGWANGPAVGASLLSRLLATTRQREDSAADDLDSSTGSARADDIAQMTARIAALRSASEPGETRQPSAKADWATLLAAYRAVAP